MLSFCRPTQPNALTILPFLEIHCVPSCTTRIQATVAAATAAVLVHFDIVWHIISSLSLIFIPTMAHRLGYGAVYRNARTHRKRHKHKTKSRPFFLDLVYVDFFFPSFPCALPFRHSVLMSSQQFCVQLCSHQEGGEKRETCHEYIRLRDCVSLAWMDEVECCYYENWK